MKDMRKWVFALCMLLCLTGCAGAEETAAGGEIAVEYKKKDLDAGWTREDAVSVVFSGENAVISGEGAQLQGDVLLITKKGDYLLEGDFTGRIVIDAKDEKVRLILGGVRIACGEGAAVFVPDADKATLTLAAGSENSIVAGDNPLYEDDEALDAAIYSKADLVINGEGALAVEAPAGHGILSRDDLRIIGGRISVRAAKDGLRGRDAFLMCGGSVNVVCGGDGIQSNHDGGAGKGYVSLDGGEIVIDAQEDGIQAETTLQLRGGSVDIRTGEGSGEWSDILAGRAAASDVSRKGLKAGSALLVTGGTAMIDAEDDAFHSDGSVTISCGVMTLGSGDDGIHAGSMLSISGGVVSVVRSYEGLEGMGVRITGGAISVSAADDGVNAAGGEDGIGSEWDQVSGEGMNEILIAGGVIRVNAGGDGVDSNGALRFTGGETYISGPSDNENGALDSTGGMTISGGVLLAAGSPGEAVAPKADGQAVTMITTADLWPGGEPVSVFNGAGEELASFTPEKDWSNIVVSLPGLSVGGTLKLYVDGRLTAFVPVGSVGGK